MQALALIAHTPPKLVADIIKRKLGPKAFAIDPKEESDARIIMFTDMSGVRRAIKDKRHEKSIFVAVVSTLEAHQIKNAYPLDFEPKSLKFLPMPICKFDTLFGMCEDKYIKSKLRFRKKSLLNKIIDDKMSSNIISLSQTLFYDIATKPKRKILRKYLADWLNYPAATRPRFEIYLDSKKDKFKPIPKSLIKKFRNWQDNDKRNPANYAKFLSEAKGKTNKEIPAIAAKYNINSFDGITLVAWVK